MEQGVCLKHNIPLFGCHVRWMTEHGLLAACIKRILWPVTYTTVASLVFAIKELGV